MKILQVIHDFLPRHQAGSELYCYHVCKALQRLGHEVSLFYSEIDHRAPSYSVRRGSYDGIPYAEIVNNHAFSSYEETYANPAVESAFSNYLDEWKPDVVHYHHLLNLSFGCVRLCKERNIPVVFTLHDYWLTCPRGGGQRFRGPGLLCHDVDTALCAECISRYTFPSGRSVRWIKRALRVFEKTEDATLLTRLQRGKIETPNASFVSRGECTIDGIRRPVLFAHPPSRVTVRTDIPPAATLAFAVAMDPGTYDQPGDGVRFRVSCGGELIFERFLHSKENPADRGWHNVQVSLEAWAGTRADLVFETDAKPSGVVDFCTACWAEPRILSTETVPYRPSWKQAVQSWGETVLTAVQRRSLKEKVDRRTARTRQLFADVDLFVAPSPFLRRAFVEYGLPEDKIVFSDYGIASKGYETEPRKVEGPIRFAFVGTLVEHKGLHVLIEAFNRLPGDRAVLNVYGSLDEFTDYVHRIRSLIAHPGIALRGRAENDEIPAILRDSDVLVVPSIWFENSPITIHEAFLARVPVITSRLGGMADLVRHEENGLLFDAGSPEDLHRCLAWCVDDPARIEALRPSPADVKSLPADAEWLEETYLRLRRGKENAAASPATASLRS